MIHAKDQFDLYIDPADIDEAAKATLRRLRDTMTTDEAEALVALLETVTEEEKN